MTETLSDEHIARFNKICKDYNIDTEFDQPIDLKKILSLTINDNYVFYYWIPEWKMSIDLAFVPENLEELVRILSRWHEKIDKKDYYDDYIINNDGITLKEKESFEKTYEDAISHLAEFGRSISQWYNGL